MAVLPTLRLPIVVSGWGASAPRPPRTRLAKTQADRNDQSHSLMLSMPLPHVVTWGASAPPPSPCINIAKNEGREQPTEPDADTHSQRRQMQRHS